MINKVRGKFNCTKNVKTSYGAEVSFWALYSNNPEDNSYAQATPSGNISMVVSNPEVIDFFKEGQAYYLDFSKVNE